MRSVLSILVLAWMLATSLAKVDNKVIREASAESPTVQLLNGSYYGLHNEDYNQDIFLGIPYAQPPTGDLRLRPPQSLNSSWPTVRNATEYGYACIGYGEDTEYAAFNYINEDCLSLNVVRPRGEYKSPLPVTVWIHGGGFTAGASLAPQYNLSFIVQQSVEIGKPIIAVSINYRLSGWGFLHSEEVVRQGVANLGIRDQRLALRWVQENIGSFHGDPSRVTIWGESAGAASVGALLLAHNGRDDNLFSAAILQSGAPVGFGTGPDAIARAERTFASVVGKVGCQDATDKVACLRLIPTESLSTAIASAGGYTPLIDGDIVAQHPLRQLAKGMFIKVPLLFGDTNDEGTTFAPIGLNTDADFRAWLSTSGFSQTDVNTLAALYPFTGPPDADSTTLKSLGLQFKRVSDFVTDAEMKAPRRVSSIFWLRHGGPSAPVFAFNWNESLAGVPKYWGVSHAFDLPYTFHNTIGSGFTNHSLPWYGPNPFSGRPKAYYDLADTTARMWVSFMSDHNPNYVNQIVPYWPPYNLDNKTIMDFTAATPSRIIADTQREEGSNFHVKLALKEAGLCI